MAVMEVLVYFMLSSNFFVCGNTYDQYYATTIYANNQYYVFWSDYRHYSPDYSLFGARVSNSGTVLDPNGKCLFRRQAAYEPRVACDGTNLLVAIRDSC
jgi:hypothetical protein